MPEVTLHGRVVPYLLVRNPRSRHVRMALTPDGLRVSAPPGVPEHEVRAALVSRERWLLRHADMLDPAPPAPLVDGMDLPFLDGHVRLAVRAHARASVTFLPHEGQMMVAAPDPGRVRALVERGYRHAARCWFERACAGIGPAVGARAARISVRDPRTRWGSCSARGTVSFSWRLLMAPARVAEYVVVHELAHLVHLDHSPAFWALVDEVRPAHRDESAWLRDNGAWLWRAPGAGDRPPGPSRP